MLYLLGALAVALGLIGCLVIRQINIIPWRGLGSLIGFFLPRLKGGSEKAKGTLFVISIVIIAACCHFLVFASGYLVGTIALVMVSAIIFKLHDCN